VAKHLSTVALVIAIVCGAAADTAAQRGGPPQPPGSAKSAAPIDLTGQWVSVISEDWRWRMVTPLKGDFANIPMNAEGRKVGMTWDPVKDEAAGEACRSYAAPAVMRVPGRVRISWEDDDTLKIDTDAGMQTRRLRFKPVAIVTGGPYWQGESIARWETPARGAGPPAGFGLGLGQRAGTGARTLEVMTTRIRPGYLRKNGVPFSADTTVTEYYDVFKEPSGTEWFVVTTIVRDPQYLNGPWVTTTNFKRESDQSKWNPTPCTAR
jgi:hypothetical protein